MEQAFSDVLHILIIFLESVGAATIMVASIAASTRLVVGGIRERELRWRAVHDLLGRGLVLGLEFLIGADILKTMLTPALTDLAVLGGTVILRTILSLSVEYELRHMGGDVVDGNQ